MIQHIYDPDKPLDLSSPFSDMMFHINVFAAADKYDVPSLRVLVVSRFTQLMKERQSTSQQEFCTVIRHLCGQNAVSLADASLQKSAAAFCSERICSLNKSDVFVNMLEECGTFAARLLTTFLKDKKFIYTFRCQKCVAISRLPRQEARDKSCFTCGVYPPDIGDAGTHERYCIMEL
jgi:hypothetical protein